MNGLAFAHSLYLGGGAGTPTFERPPQPATLGRPIELRIDHDPIFLARPDARGARRLMDAREETEKSLRDLVEAANG